jgi:hypothetical protein
MLLIQPKIAVSYKTSNAIDMFLSFSEMKYFLDYL